MERNLDFYWFGFILGLGWINPGLKLDILDLARNKMGKKKKKMFSEMKRALDKESDKFSLKDCSVKKMNW